MVSKGAHLLKNALSNNPHGKILGRCIPFIALFLIYPSISVVNANDLYMKVLGRGNPTFQQLKTYKTDSFRISTDQKKLLRNDQQFTVTSAFALAERSSQGNDTFSPYSGNEDINFDTGLNLDFPVHDIRFGAVNTSYWLGETMDLVKRLGQLRWNPMKINVYSHCKDMLNAYYHTRDNYICIGHLFKTLGRNHANGMAGMAWDADVIVHELGHGILKHIATMTTDNYVSLGNDMLGAMNEGQADFISHVVTGTTDLGPWMMKLVKDYLKVKNPEAYEGVKNKKFLRKINNLFSLSKDYFGEIHSDGRIFTGALYDISQELGPKHTLKLWFEALSKAHKASNYYDYGKLLLAADRTINNGRNKTAIIKAFQKRGIFGNPQLNVNSLEVRAKVIDDPRLVLKVLKSLGVSEAQGRSITRGLNNNGRLDANECVSVELSFRNYSQNNYVGVEMFAPKHLLPKGLKSVGQNRNYVGLLGAKFVYPKRVNLGNSRRPWLLLCADKTVSATPTLKIALKSSAENTEVFNVEINRY